MNYPAMSQTPVLEGNNVVAWRLRVRAEDGQLFGEIEEQADIPVNEQRPLQEWDIKDLELLLREIANARNMHYRATKIVMDAKSESA